MKTDVLIVGGDGDLALRKLYPSLYYLELNNCMPENTRIIGCARTGQTQEEFLGKVKSWLVKQVDSELYSEEKWQSFSKKIQFGQCDATNPESLTNLRETALDDDATLVVYLAIPPTIFGKVCSSLDVCGLAKPSTRLVVEKPLGDSRESFLAINKELTRAFSEEQLFRIDHYLGKETVQNLLALRFGNDIFEPLWNNKYIDHIQITVTETVGVGNRWAFYDQTGATRDMVQNHLLQVLCLMGMEAPAALNADQVRAEKLKVLNGLKPIMPEDVECNTIRAQYERGEVDGEVALGYLEEESDKYEIDPNSQTETYVTIRAEIENWRWSGVPIYLRTGKRLHQRHSEIAVQFKKNEHKVFKDGAEPVANRLIIRLQPDAGIRLELNTKVQGLEAGIPLQSGFMDVDLEDKDKILKHDAYSRLLFDVLRNDQTLFVSAGEVEAAWKWIDQIFASWKEVGQKCVGYPAGSEGPDEAAEIMNSCGLSWYEGEAER